MLRDTSPRAMSRGAPPIAMRIPISRVLSTTLVVRPVTRSSEQERSIGKELDPETMGAVRSLQLSQNLDVVADGKDRFRCRVKLDTFESE